MPRKKRKKIEKEKKEEVKKPDLGIPLHVFFAIRGIKEHRQAGMKVYKDAEKKRMSLAVWDEFFKNY